MDTTDPSGSFSPAVKKGRPCRLSVSVATCISVTATMTSQRLAEQIEFVHEIDKLKNVLRRTYLTDNSRRENTAELEWIRSRGSRERGAKMPISAKAPAATVVRVGGRCHSQLLKC